MQKNDTAQKAKYIPEFSKSESAKRYNIGTLSKFERGDALDISWTVDDKGNVIRN